jgi:protein-S-isoprenylcysteine O-methyltransferase Ste14
MDLRPQNTLDFRKDHRTRGALAQQCSVAVTNNTENEDALATLRCKSAWERFRATKTYDFLAASPLIFWCGFCLHAQLPLLMRRAAQLGGGSIDLGDFLQFAAIGGTAAFFLLAIYLLMIRTKPLARSNGILPRFTGFVGSFFGTSVLFLPAAHLTLPMQAISNVLIFGGNASALCVLYRLGRAFAILPEARQLETSGPYAVVRHPLYVAETVALFGLMLQFQQPWSLLIMIGATALMGARAVNEEHVLAAQFSRYGDYCSRTARFVPHVY